MNAKESSQYSEKQIEKIERIYEAIEKRYEAEAKMESHQKFRIIFQRGAKQMLIPVSSTPFPHKKLNSEK